MKNKLFGIALLGVVVSSLLTLPALADEMRARVKTVDSEHQSVTLLEGGKDYNFTITPDTKFLNAKDGALANGLSSNDLKEGRRVIAVFELKDGQRTLTSLKIRPK